MIAKFKKWLLRRLLAEHAASQDWGGCCRAVVVLLDT